MILYFGKLIFFDVRAHEFADVFFEISSMNFETLEKNYVKFEFFSSKRFENLTISDTFKAIGTHFQEKVWFSS